MSNDERKLLDLKLEMLRHDLMENKIYIEMASVTLFFIILAFLGTDHGMRQLAQRTMLGYVILINAALLFIAIAYMFINILYTINSKMEKIKQQKKGLLRNWLEND